MTDILYTAYIRPIALWKLEKVIRGIDAEVGGLGYVSQREISNGQHLLVVEDLAPLPFQEVSKSSVDAGSSDVRGDIPDMTAFLHMDCNCPRMAHEYGEEHKVFKHADELLFSWHSHNTMSTYFSSTDLTQIIDYGNQTRMKFLISYVGNKKGEFKARLDQYRPFKVGTEIELQTLIPSTLDEWVRWELDTKVSERPTTVKTYGGYQSKGSQTTKSPTGSSSAGSDKKDLDHSRSVSRSTQKTVGVGKQQRQLPNPESKNQQKKRKRRERREAAKAAKSPAQETAADDSGRDIQQDIDDAIDVDEVYDDKTAVQILAEAFNHDPSATEQMINELDQMDDDERRAVLQMFGFTIEGEVEEPTERGTGQLV